MGLYVHADSLEATPLAKSVPKAKRKDTVMLDSIEVLKLARQCHLASLSTLLEGCGTHVAAQAASLTLKLAVTLSNETQLDSLLKELEGAAGRDFLNLAVALVCSPLGVPPPKATLGTLDVQLAPSNLLLVSLRVMSWRIMILIV